MKKRVKTQPTNQYYSSEPAVSSKLMADKALVPSPAAKSPKMVDKKPAEMSGMAGFVSKGKPKGRGATGVPKPRFPVAKKAHSFKGKR